MSNSGTRMKREANAENEVHDVAEFRDAARNVVTPVLQLPPDIALAVVTAFTKVVRDAKRSESATTKDKDGITRFQTFEEGDVYMLEAPFNDFFADRYLMDFYNVEERGVCSRMHMHTGLRFVRMMTGPDTRIRVSSLSPFEITGVTGVTPSPCAPSRTRCPTLRRVWCGPASTWWCRPAPSWTCRSRAG